ncbi:hypothetical protein JCM11251_000931 [Rhodosporidiobolus azoricus]
MAASKTTAPFGSWPSPVTTDVVLSSAVQLAELRVSHDKQAIAWLEGRPQEGGRNALVYRRLNGAAHDKEEVLPDTSFNCRTRVHEYGGGSWAFEADGAIVFSSVQGPAYRVARAADGKWSKPEQVTPDSDVLRFADFAPHPSSCGHTLAIIEDHTHDTPSTVVNTLALLSPGKKVTTLVKGNDFYSAPRWSPSGEWVSWVTWVHPDMPWESSELWVAKVNPDFAASSSSSPLVEGSAKKVAGELNGDESVSQPRWAQTGEDEKEKLVFLSDRTGFYEMYEFEPEKDGGEVKLLLPEATGADVGGPDWIFGQSTHTALSLSQYISSAPSGSLRLIDLSSRSSRTLKTPYVAFEDLHSISSSSVVVIGKPSTAPAVVSLLTFEGDDVKEEVLTRSSTATVDPAFIPEAEKISFPVSTFPSSSGIGHALYYPPSSGTHTGPPGSLPPLIARCHGGPTAAARRGLDWLVAFFCSRGFGFVDIDYGGSTGYGKEYRNRLKGNWGIVDVKDSIEAVEYLVKEGKVDKEKVAITGGSAGGFTVLAALCDSKVFTAGTSSYGVSDLKLLADDTHKFESQYLFKLLGGTPDEVPQNYHDRSPINKSSQISAPLLLLQGTMDKVVPPAQSELMAERIKAAGGKVRLDLYEGESHGWRGREAKERAMKAEVGWYRETWGLDGEEP